MFIRHVLTLIGRTHPHLVNHHNIDYMQTIIETHGTADNLLETFKNRYAAKFFSPHNPYAEHIFQHLLKIHALNQHWYVFDTMQEAGLLDEIRIKQLAGLSFKNNYNHYKLKFLHSAYYLSGLTDNVFFQTLAHDDQALLCKFDLLRKIRALPKIYHHEKTLLWFLREDWLHLERKLDNFSELTNLTTDLDEIIALLAGDNANLRLCTLKLLNTELKKNNLFELIPHWSTFVLTIDHMLNYLKNKDTTSIKDLMNFNDAQRTVTMSFFLDCQAKKTFTIERLDEIITKMIDANKQKVTSNLNQLWHQTSDNDPNSQAPDPTQPLTPPPL